MIAGSPPGRVAKLFSAWVDWLFAKLSPPPAKRQLNKPEPPKLVTSNDNPSRAA